VWTVAGRFHEDGRTGMASGTKKKTTVAKLAREQKLRERRQDNWAKRDARERAGEVDPAQLRDTTRAGLNR